MGVPRLFKWLCDRYSRQIQKFDKTKLLQPVDKVDNLYIDANAILHGCAQKIFNYGSEKRLMDPNTDKTFEEKRLMVFELFFERIVALTKVIQPTRLLYIAIDGCAPAGKMAQQRQRRFMSALNNISSFDSNCLSPGTDFMDKLQQFMNFKILEKFETLFKDIEVIFSSPDVPGEGEHKIIEYIRSREKSKKEKHCMFGPDGDLIMLTLAISQCEKFYLLRDDQYNIGQMDLINIGNVRRMIMRDMGSKSINDFILIGFFVGNDFLPKIQMFYMLEDGMDLMFRVYAKIGKLPLTLPNGDINFVNFAKFVAAIQNSEPEYIGSQIDMKVNDPQFENKTLMKCITTIKGASDIYHEFDYELYQTLYNKKIRETSNEKNIEKVVTDYIQGLDWVYKYYTQGCPSFRWCYPHYYAPLMIDFKKHIVESFHIEYSKKDKNPHYKYQQLLAILPPKSRDLLPQQFANLLVDDNSPIIDLYPQKFEIDYEGKYQAYQGIAILPLVDYDRLEKVYSEYASESKVGHIYKFSSSEKAYRYNTSFGSVKTKTKREKTDY